jgi:hypothetical protein
MASGGMSKRAERSGSDTDIALTAPYCLLV